jgi:hypothetical protein
MNHVTALAVARSLQQDRLLEAELKSARVQAPRPPKASRPSYFGEMAQVLVLGYRQRPAPSR